MMSTNMAESMDDLEEQEISIFKEKLNDLGFNTSHPMTEDDIKDVALMALHGDLDGVDIPGPTENAVEEALRTKVNLQPDEKADLEFNIDDLDFVTDGEEETDIESHLDILQKAGILGDVKMEPAAAQEEQDTVKDLLFGLSLAEKGHQLLAKGCTKIRNAIFRMPSLHKLSGLLEIIKTTDPDLVVAANKTSKLPQTQSNSLPSIYKPKLVNLEEDTKSKSRQFRCRICERDFGSYVGCDSHIRREHTGIKYGPCPKCSFTSTAYDSFNRHLIKCNAGIKQEM